MRLIRAKCGSRTRLISLAVLSFTLVMVWISRNHEASVFRTWYKNEIGERQIQEQSTVPGHCGPGRIAPKGQNVKVNGTKTLLVSAYQEHRGGHKEVRVITVVLRSEKVDYRCLICCENELHVSKGVNNILSSHYYFEYGPAHIMCPLPSGCHAPSHITLLSAGGNFTEGLSDDLDTFLEVRNQETKEDNFTHNFTVCVSAMFDFTNVLQLVQSLEMLQLLGVSKVAVYLTNSSRETEHILEYYTQKGLIDVIPWSIPRLLKVSRSWLPSLSPGDIHYFGQIPALNDCIYRYMYQTKYLAVHDTDELILPQSVTSWTELLPLLEKQHGGNQCYSFQNNLFPINVILPPPGSQTLAPESLWSPGSQNVPGVNILAHLYQEPIIERTRFTQGKLILNPRGVISPDVHIIGEGKISCSWVDRNVARMYHTRMPLQPGLTPDKLLYDGRILNYSAQLMPAVRSVLTDSGLVPERSKL